MADEPRILLTDIETAPIVAYVWSLRQDYIAHDQIAQDWFLLCASWKWLHAKNIESVDFLSSPGTEKYPDLGVIKKMHGVMDSADVIVAQNGDRFDIKKLKTRMWLAGFKPPRPFRSDDTLKMLRKEFAMTSNKLDAVSKATGGKGKIKTDFDLWRRCLARDRAAVRYMVRYNREDVNELERLYLKLLPWSSTKCNHAIGDVEDQTCPRCGAVGEMKSRGIQHSRTTASRRFQCGKCHAWSSRPCGSKVVR